MRAVTTSIEPIDLPGRPGALAAPGGEGPVYALCAGGGEHLLCAVGPDGGLRWSRRLEGWSGGPLRVAPDGGVWFDHGGALREFLPTGEPGRRVEPGGERAGERIGAFLVLPDGFLIAWQTEPHQGCRVELTDGRGARRWSAELPVPPLSYRGVVESSAADGWRTRPARPWSPRSFTVERWEGLLVSGDRALATYSDYSSGIGMSYCVDMRAGRCLWSTPPIPPGGRAIADRDGSFYIGAQGYGAFETSLYDRDGAVVLQWPSHGRPLVSSRGRTRVIELENRTPSRSRARRLHRDGSMTDGPVLPGYHTVGPVLSADGRAAFWRDGRLQTADPELAVRTLCTAEGWTGVDRMLLLDGGLLAFVLDRGGRDGRLVFARTDLAPLDTGVWPCGEGGLRADPVV